MATAPRPGGNRPDRTIIITVLGEKSVLRIGDLGARDDALVRRETRAAGVDKMSLMGALSGLDEQSMGLDMVCLLWWLGRRRAGDTTQSYGDALDGFPGYSEIGNAITIEEIVDDEDEEDIGSPEA